MKRLLIPLGMVLALVLGACYVAVHTVAGQDALLARAAGNIARQSDPEAPGLRVHVCGSAAPLPAPGRANACIAVLTPEHFVTADELTRRGSLTVLEQPKPAGKKSRNAKILRSFTCRL